MRESESTPVIAADVEQMRGFGAALAAAISPLRRTPLVIYLEGELGVGKTTLVGGFLNSLGLRGPVRSPTYTLIEPYPFENRTIHHLDLYRLVDPSEVEALGIRDLLEDDAVLLIEWPEKGGSFVPRPDLRLSIAYADAPQEGRTLRVSALTAVGAELKSQYCLRLSRK